ncbi:MAG: hypothetical protein ACK4UJ_07465 [Leptonema sp. (in: bacteria)]
MKKLWILILVLAIFSMCGKKKTPLWFLGGLINQDAIVNNASNTTTVPIEQGNTNDNGGGTSSNNQVGNSGLNITYDNTYFTQQSNPTGSFEGVVLAGPDSNTNAFGSVVPNCTNVSCLLDRILNAVSGWSQVAVNGYSLINRQVLNNSLLPTELANLQLTLNESKTANQLRNDLIQLIGTVDGSGNVSNFPEDPDNANLDTQFRVVIQAAQDTNGNAVVIVGVTTVSNYSNVEDELSSLTDGTNVGPAEEQPRDYVDTLLADNPPKADFLFVVDNSGSMHEEQNAVINNSLLFFDRLENLGVDFQLGTITTDSSAIRGGNFTNNRTQFNNNINAGLNGSGKESCVYFAEKAISHSSPNNANANLTYGGGSLNSVGSIGYPRGSSKLAIICLTDESDAYTKWDGSGSNTDAPRFNYSENIFLSNQYVFYAVMPLNSSGQYGSCTGVNGNANVYYNFSEATFATAALNPQTLAINSGGSVSSICGENYGAFLQQLADQVAAQASSYMLSRIPISSTIKVYLNGQEIERTTTPTDGQTGYKYISSENKIVFTGRIPAVGSTIQIAYQSYQQ